MARTRRNFRHYHNRTKKGGSWFSKKKKKKLTEEEKKDKMLADLKKEKCPGGFGPSTHGKELCCNNKEVYDEEKKECVVDNKKLRKKRAKQAAKMGKKIAEKATGVSVTGTLAAQGAAAAAFCFSNPVCPILLGLAFALAAGGLTILTIRKVMKDKKKLQALTDVGKEVIEQLKKFADPPYNDREAALFIKEIEEKSKKIGGILGLKKKIKDTFALIEEAKNYIEQKKESLKYMKVKDKDGNETTVYNFGLEGAKKAMGTVMAVSGAFSKFKGLKTKKKGKPKLEPCKKPPNDISPEQEKNLILQYALSCNEIQNINRMNQAIEIIKKWSSGEVMDSQLYKYPSDWKIYIENWSKKNNVEGNFKEQKDVYWKEYEDTMTELKNVIKNLNKKFDKTGDESSILKTISKKFNGLLNQIKNDKFHDRLNKIFADKLKDIKDNLTFNEKNKLKDFYDIFKTNKNSPLDTTMPEQENYMYQFVKNKLEPFVTPISKIQQVPPQSKQQPSNKGSAPQQQTSDAPEQQTSDAPEQQTSDAPQQQTSDAPEQQASDIIDEQPLQQDPTMEKYAPNTNIIMNTTRKTARFMANMANRVIKMLDRIILRGGENKRKTRKFRNRRYSRATRKIY